MKGKDFSNDLRGNREQAYPTCESQRGQTSAAQQQGIYAPNPTSMKWHSCPRLHHLSQGTCSGCLPGGRSYCDIFGVFNELPRCPSWPWDFFLQGEELILSTYHGWSLAPPGRYFVSSSHFPGMAAPVLYGGRELRLREVRDRETEPQMEEESRGPRRDVPDDEGQESIRAVVTRRCVQ